jgi:uncharacterized repeat protein (TIGR04138 family)
MPQGVPPEKTIDQVAEEVGLYPPDAFEFVRRGLQHTVDKLHAEKGPDECHHVSGQQLSEGLREFALKQWGMLARTVLRRWNINRTDDFGQIVFALVANGYLSTTEQDSIDDFKNVFDFRTAFEEGYRIECNV